MSYFPSSSVGLGTEFSILTAAGFSLVITDFLTASPFLRGRGEERPGECACGGGKDAVREWDGQGEGMWPLGRGLGIHTFREQEPREHVAPAVAESHPANSP